MEKSMERRQVIAGVVEKGMHGVCRDDANERTNERASELN